MKFIPASHTCPLMRHFLIVLLSYLKELHHNIAAAPPLSDRQPSVPHGVHAAAAAYSDGDPLSDPQGDKSTRCAELWNQILCGIWH